MIVVITGGRDYANPASVRVILDQLHYVVGIDEVYHGGATGADTFAEQWASSWGVTRSIYHPDWGQHGKAAGPLRNRRMLEHAKACAVAQRVGLCVLAFPGGRGTADCIRQARELGIRVREFA